MKLLFVDDEPRILTGIENALIFANDDWDADFASSGEDAIALVAAKNYDVIVTDMKMPGLNGADVLEHARAVHPKIIRLILSGEVDPELAERAMPLAHEFVSKPCDPDDLFQIIDRVYNASQALTGVVVRDVVGSLDRLPSQPNLHLRIQEALEHGEGATSIARLIESDLAIASTIIKTANSAFYGFRTRAESIKDAVVRLGVQTVTGIVLNAEIASWASPEMSRHVATLNSKTAMTADLVRKMVAREVSQAPLAGLLHDVGLLVLITQFPDEYNLLQATGSGHEPDQDAEREIFGASHGEIGACMLEMWNADPVVVETARHHQGQRPQSITDDARRIIDAITAVDFATGRRAEHPPDVDPDLIMRAETLVAEASNESRERD